MAEEREEVMAIPKATREAIKAGIMASFANKQDQLRKELEEVGDNLLAQLLAPHADAMAQLPEDFFLSSSCFGVRFDANSGIHGKQELPLSRPHRIPHGWGSYSAAHGAPALNADPPPGGEGDGPAGTPPRPGFPGHTPGPGGLADLRQPEHSHLLNQKPPRNGRLKFF
jgi:hypothetical protein